MSLIDFILNVAGVLLWLNWRAIRFDPFARATPATLAGTLRRAEPSKLKRWHFLAALAGFVFARAVFYWQIGPAVNWTPRLDLVVVTLAFRGNAFVPVLLFSLLSFVLTLAVFYFWLLALAVINRRVLEPDPFQKMVLLQLGRLARWPRFAQAIVPLFTVAALWIALHPALVQAGVVNRTQSNLHLAEQGLLVGAGMYLSLKFLLPAFLFLHLVASYVYLGNSPLWDFVNLTARNTLAPLNRLPLRIGRVDFAPLVGICLILLLLHGLPNLILNQLDRNNLTIWPQ
jgi:uncharacterized protein YggT (Ycf19 family)